MGPETAAGGTAAGHEAAAILRSLSALRAGVRFDGSGRVVGFWGLDLEETPQRLVLEGGRTLYAWCALDALFLPAALGAVARVDGDPPRGRPAARLRPSAPLRRGAHAPRPRQRLLLYTDGTLGDDTPEALLRRVAGHAGPPERLVEALAETGADDDRTAVLVEFRGG